MDWKVGWTGAGGGAWGRARPHQGHTVLASNTSLPQLGQEGMWIRTSHVLSEIKSY